MNRWYKFQEEYIWQPYRIRPLAVWAMRMNDTFEVKTLTGIQIGKAGDWLVRTDDGEQVAVNDENFRKFYARREWKGAKNEKESGQSYEGHALNFCKTSDEAC